MNSDDLKPKRDVFHLSGDEDLGSILKKIKSSKNTFVALVCPRGLESLKSNLNIKLIKKESVRLGRKLILVTDDINLTKMAHACGVVTADSLNSKPVLPGAPEEVGLNLEENETVIDGREKSQIKQEELPNDLVINDNATTESLPEEDILEADGAISDLTVNDEETINKSSGISGRLSRFKGKNSKVKVASAPDFYAFRKKLIKVCLLLIPILAAIIIVLMQKSNTTVNIKVKAKNLPVAAEVKLVTELSPEPAEKELKVVRLEGVQPISIEAKTTGKLNIGAKATGSMSIKNCTGGAKYIAAGTRFTSGGKSFLSVADVSIVDSNYFINGVCKNDGVGSVNVIAESAGVDYNLAASQYEVNGLSSLLIANGSAMSGGTDELVAIVDQKDVDGIAEAIKTQDGEKLKKDLETKLTAGQRIIPETFKITIEGQQSNPAVGERSDIIKASATVKYEILAVDEISLNEFLKASAMEGENKEVEILDYGIGSLTLKPAEGGKFLISGNLEISPSINKDDLKSAIKGKKKGEAGVVVNEKIDDLVSSEIIIKPFWSSKIGNDEAKIYINIEIEKNN